MVQTNENTQKQEGTAGYRPPRDAAAVVLVDDCGGNPRVLMGCRSSRHVFMPDTYVFPGGKCDPTDHARPFRGDLHPEVMEKLRAGPPGRLSAARGRALALAALRELEEETGLAPRAGPPDLSRLHLAVRAITPPGHVRRYDTRFFLAFTSEVGIDPALARDTDELKDLQWVDMASEPPLNIPQITRCVLMDVRALLARRPDLPFANPVPFYRTLHGRAMRTLL